MNKVENIAQNRPKSNAESKTRARVYTHIPNEQKRYTVPFLTILDDTMKKDMERERK